MRTLCIGAAILVTFGTMTGLMAKDVGDYYWVLKKADYDQLSTANPTPSQLPFQFNSAVERDPNGSFPTGSTITPPGSGAINTPQFYSNVDGGLNYDAFFVSQGTMDTAFGYGGYFLNIKGGSSNPQVTLSLVGNLFPANIPKVSNPGFINGQLVIDATKDFTLSWNAFSDFAPLDQIIVTIYDGSLPVVRSVLSNSAVGLVLAANTLEAERNYTMEVMFVKVSQKNTASIPGSTGLTGLANSTHINISTSSGVPVSGLANISTRAKVGVGINVLISGFIVTNTDHVSTQQTIVRAIGPTLGKLGVAGALQDPILTVYDSTGKVIGTNDNWGQSPTADQVESNGLAPSDARESALYLELAAGAYTVVVYGKNNTTGVGVVEAYDLGTKGDAKMVNISTRGLVLTADQVMIGGLIVKGISHTILFRALGPSLKGSGVPNPMPDPTMQLYNIQGVQLALNNNWKDTQQAEIAATGIPPTNDLESAIIRFLTPGNYTAIVRAGGGGITGVGLVEAYDLGE